jgi:hypothetical protein
MPPQIQGKGNAYPQTLCDSGELEAANRIGGSREDPRT